ncbi:unnamed protein product [Echinostoma caproni]|uniref:Reverse transcriptase domain-containing protein n=1 Tax=Echinostoma caproni TaxID=27848 RepID=A0A183A0J2_9TREM|nr:unnamed protein product [Echinostoma caproni]
MTHHNDVIVFETTKEVHDNNLKKLLERFMEKNVCTKPSKCMFGMIELEFLGFTVRSKGCRPDRNRFKPLVDIESPKDQNNLPSIIYLFLISPPGPNLSLSRNPLQTGNKPWTTKEPFMN